MKKLFLTYTDGSKITFTFKRNGDNHMEYLNKYSKGLSSAILQLYPKKENIAIDLLERQWEVDKI